MTQDQKPRKDDLLRIRMTAEQKTALEQAASDHGLDLSAWARQTLFRAAGLLPVERQPAR